MDCNRPPIIFIVGPTCSGKTQLGIDLGLQANPGVLWNADVGQFFQKLSIGVAKPSLEDFSRIKHEGFDLLQDLDEKINANHYRLLTEAFLKGLDLNVLPIIVGGSFFYIKSLFFRFFVSSSQENNFEIAQEKKIISKTWDDLYLLDPKRAKNIHPHDLYRIKRAFDIWEQTGLLPSQCEPVYDPVFSKERNKIIIAVTPPLDSLKLKIKLRAHQMLFPAAGLSWVDEVSLLLEQGQRDPLIQASVIGYKEIIAWIEGGRHQDTLGLLEDEIVKQTFHYAKRQLLFWKSFSRELENQRDSNLAIITFDDE